MKLLAVSDIQSQSLENILENTPERYKDADCIVSCGDLEADYLEFIFNQLGVEFFFVSGNHVFRDETCSEEKDDIWKSSKIVRKHTRPCIAGYEDMHGRVKVFKNYIFAGFGGSMWYNGQENQFTEKQMQFVVHSVERKIFWIRFLDFIFRRPKKGLIVLSHAPIYSIHDLPDICHKGFECFGRFIKNISPVLWLHGHIHPIGNSKTQVTKLIDTTIINVYGCKIIEINDKEVKVNAHC